MIKIVTAVVTREITHQVLDDSRKWWKAVNARGQAAHVPHTIVTPYTPDQVRSNTVHPRK